MLRKNFPQRKELRRQDAKERQAVRAKRSNAEQLALLDERGMVAWKERARLHQKEK